MDAGEMFGSENAYLMRTNKTMVCECGTIMHQGSGQFTTDYKCLKCGRMYNSAGSEVHEYLSEADEYAHEGENDPY